MITEASTFADYAIIRQQWEELAAGSAWSYRRDAPDLLQQRLSTLTIQAPEASRIDFAQGNFQHFIGPNTALYPRMHGIGFVMDDAAVYKGALRSLPHYIRRSIDPTADAYSTAAFHAIQYGQERYFGPLPNRAGQQKRQDLLMGRIENPVASADTLSIAAFKQIAECVERTAAANNMLHVLGYAPVYETGLVKVDRYPSQLHAFLVSRDADGLYLYDPTNPSEVYTKKGRFVETQPALYEVNDLLVAERGVVVTGLRHEYVRSRRKLEISQRIRMRFSTPDEGQLLQPA